LVRQGASLNIYGQILLGSDIPVEQPTKFDLTVNFTIAKARTDTNNWFHERRHARGVRPAGHACISAKA